MLWYGIFLVTIGVAIAVPTQKLHPLSDEFIEQINNKQSTWKAGRNFEVEDYELFKVLASGVKKSNIPMIHKKIHNEDQEIPEYFDSREAWPECADIIGLIRDQSRCSSSWAFAAVEAMSDRICIHSNATKKMLISAQDLISCGDGGGCDGGFPYSAWKDWNTFGIVTGGLYNHTEQGCKSYSKAPCDDHLNQCTKSDPTPLCWKECDDSSMNYTAQKTFGQYVVTNRGEKQIQLEILKNGPVEGIIVVYQDLAYYKSGIYKHIYGRNVGDQAIKIIGWGVEGNVKYWLLANSWNERWGDNGFLKIVRGELGIDNLIIAALPDFSRF